MGEFNLTTLNTGLGTYIKHNGGRSPLDLSIASSEIAIKSNWTVLDDSLGSDHLPILITLNGCTDCNDQMSIKWAIKKADWIAFKQSCKNYISESLIQSDPIEFSKNLTEAIIYAADDSIPKIKSKWRPKAVPY